MHAGRPTGPDLETYVAEIAGQLGYDYPACATATEVTNKDAPLKRLSGDDFFTSVEKLVNGYDNAELAHYHLMELVRDAGLTHVYKSDRKSNPLSKGICYTKSRWRRIQSGKRKLEVSGIF